jgi:hypothetical protein
MDIPLVAEGAWFHIYLFVLQRLQSPAKVHAESCDIVVALQGLGYEHDMEEEG